MQTDAKSQEFPAENEQMRANATLMASGAHATGAQEERALQAVKDQVERERQSIQLRKAEMVQTNDTGFINPIVYAQMKTMASDFISSKAIPKGIDNAEQLIMVFQAGYEMGMKPVEAMNSLYIVNGKITLWGPAVLRRLRNFGYYVYYDETPSSCKITVKGNGQEYEDTFLFDDAVKSGYVNDSYGKPKIGWKEGVNRKLKLRYGAISNIVKTHLPEVLGIYAGVADIEMDAYRDEPVNDTDKIKGALDKYRTNLEAEFKSEAE